MSEGDWKSDLAQNMEYVGVAEDSGFASISGVPVTDTPLVSENESLSMDEKTDDVDTGSKSIPFNSMRKRKHPDEAEVKRRAEKKRLAQEQQNQALEQYNQEVREQRYKRLMHLLDRSQFYSSYLVKKIDEAMPKPRKSAEKRKAQTVDENTPPNKKGRGKRVKIEKQDYDIREYVSSKEMKSKVQKRLNLSQEEIEKDLMSETNETEHKTKADEPLQLKYFNGSLRDYQIKGLKWLIVLYENGVNGILADEMGLGKTIQVIALICYLVQKKIAGPYLVIAPLSTIPNWLMEFENFAPQIPVVLLHGTAEERSKTYNKISKNAFDVDGYKTHPVVLTTYEVPIREQHFLQKQQWRYIVIDEGHRVKNPNCQLLQVLKKCQSMNRLLLTGTPLQNNLSELWSLLNFLLPEIFNDLAVFESWFDAEELLNEEGTERILKQEAEKKVLSSLREILKPFMLRRIKTDVCLDIPAKKEIVVYAPMSELQHSLYEAVLNRDIETLSKVKQELIIEDINGQRPLRRCRLKKDASAYIIDTSDSDRSRSSTPADDDEDGSWKNQVEPEDASLTMWRKYTSVDERNKDFLIRVTGTQRLTMYKKIVNHPFLVHCPLNDDGMPKIDEDLINNSGKLLVLDAMLKKLKAGGHKVLIFSTWTQILDMIEDYLELRDYPYCRLDGKLKIEDRKENIKLFNSDPNVFLFLVSTRAGGVGLNLASADTVIIYDSDWNPQADIQAMARCHRIGQTKPVVIYRFCTSGTIDERIIARAEAKRKLEKMVISKDAGKLNPDLGMLLEMKKLLSSNKTKIVKAENNVFTPEELDKILDRSDLIGQTEASTSE